MIASPFITLLFLIAAEQPRSIAIGDLLEKECAAGNQSSCERLEEINESLVLQKRLEGYAAEFAETVNEGDFMLDQKKPDLVAAYSVVMHDFNQHETAAGVQETLDETRMPYCAEHYHNHWVNKKLWWPTGEDNKPDWASIYEFIVDHYYGFCLRQK